MKRILIMLTAFSLCALVLACDKDEDPGGTKVQQLSNEWWAKIYVPDGNGGLIDIGLDYQHIMTSSTASPTADSIFVDDFDGLLVLKAKVACNVNSLTFHNDEPVKERYDGGTVSVANGKVLLGAAYSTSGVKVDSIYFETEFDWEPGQVYVLAGHARTGFAEDEH